MRMRRVRGAFPAFPLPMACARVLARAVPVPARGVLLLPAGRLAPTTVACIGHQEGAQPADLCGARSSINAAHVPQSKRPAYDRSANPFL